LVPFSPRPAAAREDALALASGRLAARAKHGLEILQLASFAGAMEAEGVVAVSVMPKP
jgi:hypothetical protein